MKPVERPLWQAASPSPRATWVLPVPEAEGNDVLAPLDPLAARQLQHLRLVQCCSASPLDPLELKRIKTLPRRSASNPRA